MEIRNFLQKLLDFGKQEGYFEETTIGQLKKTCCEHGVTGVIDFDRTKDIVISRFDLQTLKSADALKIVPLSHTLDFIELKGFKKFIQYRSQSHEPTGDQVREKIATFDLVNKIRDSIHILQTIVFFRQLELTKKERAVFYQIPKRFIVVIDIEIEKNPLELFAVTLSFLSEMSTPIDKQIAGILKTELDKIPDSSLGNIQKPQLMSCKSIDEFYAQFNGGTGICAGQS